LPLPDALYRALETLRTTVSPASADRQIGQPREGTEQAQVLAMLCRDEGASGSQIAKAMSWSPHTVRGFFAGLK